MFDFGFSEMLVIGVVALVVLGPEKLPTVAKTAGEWMGKAQRFVSQVKSDINREADFAGLKELQDQAKALGNEIRSTVEKSASEIQTSASALEKSVATQKETLDESVGAVKTSLADLGREVQGSIDAAGDTATTSAETTPAVSAQTEEEMADFYGWTGVEPQAPTPAYEWKEPKIFPKRYRSGPSVDELAREVERLRRELGMREAKLGGSNRRLTARARSNRARIYR